MLYNIHFSPTGGTLRVAEILAEQLGRELVHADLTMSDFGGLTLTSGDVALISIPSYAGRVPCTAVERLEMIRGNGARAILVCVYGNRAYDNTLAELQNLAELAGLRPVAAVAALAEHSMARQVAAGRPDVSDRAALTQMARRIQSKLESGDDSVPTVPGTVPDKPMGNFGGRMAPRAADSCHQCGRCADQCPVQAIDRDSLEADRSKCIGCMRCIAVCYGGHRKLPMVLESLGGVALSVLCSQRRENELFL